MALLDLVNDFNNKYKNTDLILEVNGEFLLASEVDSSILPEYQRNIVSSYPSEIFLELENKLRAYINDKYQSSGTFNFLEKQYYITNVPNALEKYKRIFYYVKLPSQSLVLIDKKPSPSSLEIIAKVPAKLDFTPTDSDKEKIINKSIGATKDFNDWYMCIYEDTNPKVSSIQGGINNVLKFLNKKGTWVSDANNIRKESKNEIKEIVTNNNINKKISQLEFDIGLFYDNNFSDVKTTELLIDKNTSYESGIAIFYKSYQDPVTSNTNFLFGFPKKLIDRFPNLSLATDIEEFKIETIATYNSFEDIQTSINTLKNAILLKKQSLSDSSLEIKNYDVDSFLTELDQFVAEINNKIQSQAIEPSSNFTFEFSKSKCQQAPLTADPKEDEVNQAIYKKCLNDFVDGQTNLVLRSVKIKDKKNLSNLSSLTIDNKISAYLFANAKNITKNNDSYVAKNFFSKLIYAKTKFEKQEGLTAKTFLDAAETSFQQAFVTGPANLVKFSKIKDNIEKQSFANKSVSQSIKDILVDIHSIKQLYEEILYRYDLKDVTDELIKCILAKNPNLNAAVIAVETFIKQLAEVVNTKDPNLVSLAKCTGINLPQNILDITPDTSAADLTIAKDQIKTSLIGAFNSAVELGTSDEFATVVIKCFDEFGPEQAKTIINKYVESEATRKALKQQYDQLVLEAKTYKKSPGSKDALDKQSQKSFFKKAARDAWTLLQRQAEKEAERLIREAAIQIIKDLLKDLNNCKPPDKNKNSNKPLGNPGDLNISLGSEGSVNSLMSDISFLFPPEKMCSLLYGSADNDFYQSALNLIKQKHPDLYAAEKPIKIKDITLSTEPLSSIHAVKQFFIVLSTEIPELTKNKCDQYFENLSNSPLPLNDENKCIDFSEQYTIKTKQDLINRGFTEQQADKIIENEKKLQTEKYKEIQRISEVGIYNEISSKSDNNVYPAADMVKEKIEKQLILLTNSFGTFVDSYKNELIKLININVKGLVANEDKFYYDFKKNQLNIQGNIVDFKLAVQNDVFSVQPQYNYSEKNDLLPYEVTVKNKNYDELNNKETANLENTLKKLLIKSIPFTSKITSFEDTEDSIWLQLVLNSSIKEFSSKTLDLYLVQINNLEQQDFNKEKILSDVKELIYFEDK